MTDEEVIPPDHVANVCQPGKGIGTCRFLASKSLPDYFCAKTQPWLMTTILARAAEGTLRSLGDNCNGPPDYTLPDSAVIGVAGDFSKYPAGRFESDGPFSGEKFRAQLVTALESYEHVTVHLNGTAGYGSGFLEEAFGGLVRSKRWNPVELVARMRLVSSDPDLVKEVWSYIEDAGER